MFGFILSLVSHTDIVRLDLDADSARQVVVDREKGQYLGHVSTVMLADGKTILAAYPKGHGKGAIVLKTSPDGGKTWSQRREPGHGLPDNWAQSQETPTLFRTTPLDTDGKRADKRLVLFSGLYPGKIAISEDDGDTWTPLSDIGTWGGIVMMGCVEALKDGSAFALFHDDGRFLRAGGKRTETMTLLKSTSHDGGLHWDEPTTVFASRDIHLCEPGLVRSPDGKRLAAMLRENRRVRNSHFILSDDDGDTWSSPKELHHSLTGDRHTAKYAPDGRLVVTFRDMGKDSPTKGDWIAWVGTFDDIALARPGQYLVRLKDNKDSWDCAYPGVEVMPDGMVVCVTYGHWTPKEEPYILSVRFTLAELDDLARASAPGAAK
jgi:hypothetical protein